MMILANFDVARLVPLASAVAALTPDYVVVHGFVFQLSL